MRYVESINLSLHKLLNDNDKVIIVGEDILDPYGGAFKVTKGLSTKFPKRVLTTPISEASIFGLCTGLAIRGFKPILEIMFGDFITLCADQLINGASKFKWMYGDQFDVSMVIRTPMGGRRGYGPTHSQTLESIFLGIPGIKIIAPSNMHIPGELLEYAVLKEKVPILFIENKSLYAESIYNSSEIDKTLNHFFIEKINKSSYDYPTMRIIIDKGYHPDVSLIAYGGMTPIAIDVMKEIFIEEELVLEVLIPSLIKPFPIDDIISSVSQTRKVVICEEGVKTSGWGAELSCLIQESLDQSSNIFIERVGSLEYPIPASKALENLVLPQVRDIIRAIKKVAGS